MLLSWLGDIPPTKVDDYIPQLTRRARPRYLQIATAFPSSWSLFALTRGEGDADSIVS